MPLIFPLTLNGSTASTVPSSYDITTRAGKGNYITPTEMDNTIITFREAINYLNNSIGSELQLTELIKPNTVTLSLSECKNTLINNYGQSSNITYTLPSSTTGLGFYLFIATGGYNISLTDIDSTLLLENLQQYDLFKIYTAKTGATEYSWIVEKFDSSAGGYIDWTVNQGAINIHSDNIPDLSSIYAIFSKGVTNGDSHDHSGGDGAAIPDTALLSGATATSAGVIDSGKIVKLNASGYVDDTCLHNLQSAYTELIGPVSAVLSTSECKNTLINNYGQSADITYTLPTPEANLNFYLSITTVGHEITLNDGDNSVILNNLEQYDLFKIYTTKTSISEYNWIVKKIT